MSPLARVALSTLPLAAALVWGWPFLIEGLGQGTHYAVAGWFATLMGVFVIAMALGPLALGLAGSMGVALALRGAPDASTRGAGLDAMAALLYVAVTLATSIAMWRLASPVASEYARYGAAFAWITALLVLSICPLAGVLAARLATHRLPVA